MPHTSPSFSDDGSGPLLLCPGCGDHHVHIDDAFVAGRPREDGDVQPVHVDYRGAVDQASPVPYGRNGAGRRHTITLGGWCESCGLRFAIVFRQHKGETEVTVLTQQWQIAGD